VPERGTFFQDQVGMGNIDSKIRHFGFYYCPFLAIGAASPTFATQSANSRLMHRSKQPLSFDNLGQI
jgi:hypothetical protein